MAKSLLRLEARKLRRKGVSVKTIAKMLGVSKSTASLWVRDLVLTVEQLENLRQSSIRGAERGRLMGALMQKERRLKLVVESNKTGTKYLSSLTEREFLIAGLALYWGEGHKKSRNRVGFCNSDPRMIKFLMRWLIKCLRVRSADLRCRVGINVIHTKREQAVREYWSKITGIPLGQFSSTSFKKVDNKKIYENFNEHYGTLDMGVVKATPLYYRIMGLIEGLARQRSSMAEQSFHKR